MFHGFFLGVLGGVAAAKLFRRFRSGGCGGGCGSHGAWHGHGYGCGSEGRGFGGRFGLFRLIHELNLTPEQWHQGHDILHDLRHTLRQGREDLRSSLGPVLSVLAAPDFDQARAEEVARQHDASFGRVRKDALAALERLHRLLTPEQRQRLQRFLDEYQRR